MHAAIEGLAGVFKQPPSDTFAITEPHSTTLSSKLKLNPQAKLIPLLHLELNQEGWIPSECSGTQNDTSPAKLCGG